MCIVDGFLEILKAFFFFSSQKGQIVIMKE